MRNRTLEKFGGILLADSESVDVVKKGNLDNISVIGTGEMLSKSCRPPFSVWRSVLSGFRAGSRLDYVFRFRRIYLRDFGARRFAKVAKGSAVYRLEISTGTFASIDVHCEASK